MIGDFYPEEDGNDKRKEGEEGSQCPSEGEEGLTGGD